MEASSATTIDHKHVSQAKEWTIDKTKRTLRNVTNFEMHMQLSDICFMYILINLITYN